jgi:arylsulfatase
MDHIFFLIPAQDLIAEQIETLKKFPPRQKPAKFNLDGVLETIQKSRAA